MLLGEIKPNGLPYVNTDGDWAWLSGDACKAARWLGYVPFGQIIDQRNAAPTVSIYRREGEPFAYMDGGVEVEIPVVDTLEPRAEIANFTGVQKFKLVLFGEKSSLRDVLGPIADAFGADLYLPTGEISDTMLHTMASVGAEDGRRMVVLCFSDCDPAGWQMPVSIARKLQAFAALEFPWLDFEVRNVALTPAQAREHGLPSTPLKATERRSDRWRQAMGVEQTEIDALATLAPDLLRRIALDAIGPFFDGTLGRRVREAIEAWERRARAAIVEHIGAPLLDDLASRARATLGALRLEIDAINDQLRLDDLELPRLPEIPRAMTASAPDEPLLDGDRDYAAQSLRLIRHKAYEGGRGGG